MNRPLRLTEWFVGVSWVNVDILRNISWVFCGMFATLLQSVRSIIGNLFAAVGADLSRPRIWMYPRNGERKRIFDNVKTRIWWNGYVYLIMLGYGRDESDPTPDGVFRCTFRGWMWTFCGVLVGCFCGVRWYFAECSQRVHSVYVTYSLCKSMVFALQKYVFWRAKSGFLHCKSMVFVFWMLCCCKLVAIYFVFECEYLAQQIWVFCDMLVAYSWVYFLIFFVLKMVFVL